MNPLKVLHQHFGYSSFRLEQENIIESVLKKQDTFVLMPTGGGKSLCYQIPALLFDGLTLVISPLIALMKDQVDALRVNGIEAAFLNSSQRYIEQEAILKKALSGELKLLYLAPERLVGNSGTFLNTLAKLNVNLVAVDEAHCISHWGHDFRPEYLMLAKLKNTLPGVPVIALTATADRLTQKDILEKLSLREPAIFKSSFNRANIRYLVQPKEKNIEKLISFLSSREDESGIIYCLSRKSTEKLAEQLNNNGYLALPYHAGLERDQRARHQDMFLRDEVRIIVATVAFGMGIDKSNVRFVVHMDLPKNIESYYQETGRAGRDGLDSEALLFYSPADVMKLKSFVRIEGNNEQTEISLKKLDQMGRFGELPSCRRKYLLNYFNENTADYCGNCDVCLLVKQSETEATHNLHADGPAIETESLYQKELLHQFKTLRKKLAQDEGVASYIVLSDASLVEMAMYLPQNLDELEKISGFGSVKLRKYGNQFLLIIVEFSTKHNQSSRIHLKKSKGATKPRPHRDSDTKKRSLELFMEGRPTYEVAQVRGLSPATIESHLAFYIQQGKLSIHDLMKPEKINMITLAIEKIGEDKLTPVKVMLGDDYTFGEIRYVLAHLKAMKVEEPIEDDYALEYELEESC
jgi:RecQ family ATP-dependent DNA helicase